MKKPTKREFEAVRSVFSKEKIDHWSIALRDLGYEPSCSLDVMVHTVVLLLSAAPKECTDKENLAACHRLLDVMFQLTTEDEPSIEVLEDFTDGAQRGVN